MQEKNITSHQCKAARSLLDWKQADLAEKSGVSLGTVINFENGKTNPTKVNAAAVKIALETAGIKFTGGDGVRRAS